MSLAPNPLSCSQSTNSHANNVADVELKPRPPAFAAKGAAAERYDARMGMIAPQAKKKPEFPLASVL